MGLWDRLKQHAGAQFLEVIDWTDDTNDTLVFRYPVFNQAITSNSKLVVREGQAAVFVSEGRLSEVFGPGTYSLDTQNAPILRFFQSIAYNLEEPYKGDIYFCNTRQYTDNGWGTATPLMVRDAEFGPVRIRAYGIYSYRITDPAKFLRQLVGTDGLFTTDEINGQLKRKLVSSFAQTVASSRIAVLDLAASYQDLGDQLRDGINPTFQESYGITLTDFSIQSVSLPEEVEKALDTRSKMGILGNLNAYTQLKAADAIGDAARNPGVGGVGASMGVGFGLGNQIGQNMMQAQQGGGAPPAPPPLPLPGGGAYHYNGPSGQAQLPLAEVVRRVAADRAANHLVWQAGWPQWRPARDVAEIAAQLPPEQPSAPAAKFHYHGPSGQSEKTLDEVVAEVRASPDAKHLVWRAGWESWKTVSEVPEIQSALGGDDAAGGPPPIP